jgi:RAB protein geranylgeranyltransferase component A
MITLNLNLPVLDPEGKPIDAPTTLGRVLSGQLLGVAKGNVMKFFCWGMDFYQDKPVMVDDADFKTITTVVEESQQLSNLVKGRILNAMEACRKQP